MRNVVSNVAPYLMAALLSLASGCAYNAYSPPARALPLETVDTLPQGAFGISGDLGLGVSIFGPDVIGASVRARKGVAEGFDASAEASFVRIIGHAREDTDEHRNVYSARIGMKYQVLPFFSTVFGVGGGASAAGGFVSPDLGAILAWENPYIVPFFAARGFVSQPIAPRAVDLGSDQGKQVIDTPKFSFGFSASVGFRVPLARDTRPTHSILAGFTGFEIFDGDNREAYFGPSASVEIVF